jgi:hypothetical protein
MSKIEKNKDATVDFRNRLDMDIDSTSNTNAKNPEDCKICFENKDLIKVHRACRGRFCRDCAKKIYVEQLKRKCFHCNRDLNAEELKTIFSEINNSQPNNNLNFNRGNDDLVMKERLCTLEGCCKVFQLSFDTANCILPGFVFFDKAVILAWSGVAVRNTMRQLGPIPKLLTSIVFVVSNSIIVQKSMESLKELTFNLEEAGEMYGEDLKFQMSLYPNSDSARAVHIALPVIGFFCMELINFTQALSASDKDEKKNETPCWVKVLEIPMAITNMFLPAFLPTQLFTHLFPLAIGQLFLGGVDVLLAFNIWAFVQWKISELNKFYLIDDQLEASFILLGVWSVLILCVASLKKQD